MGFHEAPEHSECHRFFSDVVRCSSKLSEQWASADDRSETASGDEGPQPTRPEMTAARVPRAPVRGTVFRLYPLVSPSGPLYMERVFLLRSCISQLIYHLHLYRSL